MTEDNIVNDVSEFIQRIFELNKKAIFMRSPSVSSISFYRGQSNSNWGLEPSLYRNNLLKKEGVLISEFLRVAPQHFENLSYFDTLVKMQHYGLPTRLLDTTLNPLVALFFACHGDEQKAQDGSVYIFPNLPVFRSELNDISVIMKYVFKYSGFQLDIDSFTQDVLNSKECATSYSRPYKNSSDVLYPLTKVPFYAILPTLNNARILNQDGSFLLFGMKVNKLIKSTNPGTLGKEYYEFEKINFDNDIEKFWKPSKLLKIPSNCKGVILEELEYLGITRNKMFPELEYQADFITKLIKKEIKN
ncbi:FRG domain-containing protein [Aquiflexum gelatinilyticum]|uniref:FRG domain-containing protein n=1 Tax=Aquiflexum gelatinilyticum TaxID=2961943 RepID=UPI002166D4A0|nr:FRG domain-containing protein [Aquiflexum gelatinilyticum]MCS4436675.1 FRG domain-containing protein [Aquiflexum gelatinilyticum]